MPRASSYLPACSDEPPFVSNFLLTAHAYLVLLRVEVAAFHRNLIRSSLWPWSSPHDGRPLAVTLLSGARTFLPLIAQPATAWPTSREIMRDSAKRRRYRPIDGRQTQRKFEQLSCQIAAALGQGRENTNNRLKPISGACPYIAVNAAKSCYAPASSVLRYLFRSPSDSRLLPNRLDRLCRIIFTTLPSHSLSKLIC